MCFRLINVAADHGTLRRPNMSPVEPGTPQVTDVYNVHPFRRLDERRPRRTVSAMAELEAISVVVTSVGTEQQASRSRRSWSPVGSPPASTSCPACARSTGGRERLLGLRVPADHQDPPGPLRCRQRRDPGASLLRASGGAGVSHCDGGANFQRWVVEMATGVADTEQELEAEPSFD